MERVKEQARFTGTLAEFFTFLRTDPRFFYKTGPELLDGYRALAKRIDPKLVKVFRTPPRMPYGVRADSRCRRAEHDHRIRQSRRRKRSGRRTTW